MRLKIFATTLFAIGAAVGVLLGTGHGPVLRASHDFAPRVPSSSFPEAESDANAPPIQHGQFFIYRFGAAAATSKPDPLIPDAAKSAPVRSSDDVSEVLRSPLAIAPDLIAAPGYKLTRANLLSQGGTDFELREVFEGGGPAFEVIRIPIGDATIPVPGYRSDSGITVEAIDIAGVPAVVTSGKNLAPFRLQFVTDGIETEIASIGLTIDAVRPYVEKVLYETGLAAR